MNRYIVQWVVSPRVNIRLAKYDGNYTKSSFKTHFLVCSGSRVSSVNIWVYGTVSSIFSLEQWSPIFGLNLLQKDLRQCNSIPIWDVCIRDTYSFRSTIG